MHTYRNIVIAIAFMEFIAASVIAGVHTKDLQCNKVAADVESAPTHMVCSEMPTACMP